MKFKIGVFKYPRVLTVFQAVSVLTKGSIVFATLFYLTFVLVSPWRASKKGRQGYFGPLGPLLALG